MKELTKVNDYYQIMFPKNKEIKEKQTKNNRCTIIYKYYLFRKLIMYINLKNIIGI